jgi:hypothetical protein
VAVLVAVPMIGFALFSRGLGPSRRGRRYTHAVRQHPIDQPSASVTTASEVELTDVPGRHPAARVGRADDL